MNGDRGYRALLFLYPPRFRREYGPQMVQAFGDRRRECGRRAWWTIGRDLLSTIPSRHAEAFMELSPQGRLVAGALVTTAAIVVFAAVGGAFAALLLMMLLVWILTSLLRQRGAVASPGLWWKLTGAGAGLFLVLLAVFAGPWPESWRSAVPGDVAWSGGFFGFVMAIVLMVTGLVTGIAQRVGRRPAAG
jgi:hypothetical protein